MYQNLTSNISKSHLHTSSISMSFSIKSETLNSKMKWKNRTWSSFPCQFGEKPNLQVF